MVTLMSKEKWYEDDSFVLYIEPCNDVLHMHCYVSDWKLSVLKNMYAVLAQLMEVAARRGFKYLVTVTPNPKFAKMLGGVCVEELQINDEYCEVIVWELKQPSLQ